MVKMAIAAEDIYYCKYIMNSVIDNTNNLQIKYILNTGKEVIEVVKKEEIELLVLDVKMSDMDELEIIEKIATMDIIQKPKIIVITKDSKLINQRKYPSLILNMINKLEKDKSICQKIQRVAR